MPTRKIADEAKENLSEAEVKAAQKHPAGDTELSGAAPGAKASEAATDPTFDPPAKARKAQQQADKRMDEVREIQRETQSKNLLENVPPETVRTVFATREGDKDPASLTFAPSGGGITVFASQGELRFNNREDALSLVREVNQLVSAL